jgi:hypothetical protein
MSTVVFQDLAPVMLRSCCDVRAGVRKAATRAEIPRASEHGYTLKAVAAFLGVHYATVSRASARGEGRMYASRYARRIPTVVLQNLTLGTAPMGTATPGR